HPGRIARPLGSPEAPGAKSGDAKCERSASSGAARLDRTTGPALRLLPKRHDDQGNRAPGAQAQPDGCGNQRSVHHRRRVPPLVPLRNVYRDQRCSTPCLEAHGPGRGLMEHLRDAYEQMTDVCGARLSRRSFVKAGGALVVGFGIFRGRSAKAAAMIKGDAFDVSLPASWIEIRPDNTVLFRTGKSDFGQGTISTAYRQIVADELDMPFEAITTVVSADTDTTPEGGGTFGLLGEGTPNIRKAAAYTKQAILQLASERLGVPKDQVRTADGKASGGGKEITYGELVKDQDLKLTIPVSGDLTSIFGLRITGDPPLKSASELKVVGKSFKNSIVSEKVRHDALWVTNVKLPGMLHGRVVHPTTLGSQLVQAGAVDQAKFPNTHLVVKATWWVWWLPAS